MAGFMFPPHPDTAMKIRPDSVVQLDQEGGWLAQRKYNGSHMVAHFHRGRVQLWNRTGEPFTTYKLTPNMEAAFVKGIHVDPEMEVVLDGELMHTKAKSKITDKQAIDNCIVLYDLLYLGKPLLTEGFEERYTLLEAICNKPTELEPKKRGLLVSKVEESQLWLAEIFRTDFLYRFYEMYEFDGQNRDKFPEIEGLVCKRAQNSRIRLGNVKYDVNWMMRVRKTKEKVYLF